MFRAILYTQWKWCRLVILLATLAAFALPLLSVQGARGPVGYWGTDAYIVFYTQARSFI